jgi:hypothetical protein
MAAATTRAPSRLTNASDNLRHTDTTIGLMHEQPLIEIKNAADVKSAPTQCLRHRRRSPSP